MPEVNRCNSTARFVPISSRKYNSFALVAIVYEGLQAPWLWFRMSLVGVDLNGDLTRGGWELQEVPAEGGRRVPYEESKEGVNACGSDLLVYGIRGTLVLVMVEGAALVFVATVAVYKDVPTESFLCV
ncbi:hypothetical protein F4809DRAFT_24794 [Biscogniauxia mediterranea]|nr:hypothetical protein F4809DRAFT_24794 [Biscogniauxia mediterranea]